jgi:hypothetical protein
MTLIQTGVGTSTLRLQAVTGGITTTATGSASWSGQAAFYQTTVTTLPAPRMVTTSYKVDIRTVDSATPPSEAAFNGTCNLEITATGDGSVKNPLRTVNLNGQPWVVNFTYNLAVSKIDLVIQTALVQTVTLSYKSYCANLTVVPTMMTSSFVRTQHNTDSNIHTHTQPHTHGMREGDSLQRQAKGSSLCSHAFSFSCVLSRASNSFPVR